MKRKREEAEQDPKLKEFLEVYQPPSKTNLWTNGDVQGVASAADVHDAVPEIAIPEDESDDEYQVITKKPKISEVPQDEPSGISPVLANDQPADSIVESAKVDEEMEDAQPSPDAVEQGPISDADWLRSRTNRVLELVEDDDELPTQTQVQTIASHKPSPSPQPEKPVLPEAEQTKQTDPESAQDNPDQDTTSAEEDKIRETGRLYLRNLHFDVTEEELREQFSKSGGLEEASDLLFLHSIFAMMNVKIGTTDASAFEVDL